MKTSDGYRSKLEANIANQLTEFDAAWAYEQDTIPYSIPKSNHMYHPDFAIDTASGTLYIECKGRHRWGGLDKKTRDKMSLVKEQHPDLDIRFIFDRAGNKIGNSPKSKTWEKWCDENGFKYAIKNIPEEWLD